MFSYALSEPEAGSDAAAMKTRAVRDGDTYILNGVKRWITNAGISRYYTVMAVTHPAAGSRGVPGVVRGSRGEGFSVRAPEHKPGVQGSPAPGAYFAKCRVPARPLVRGAGSRLCPAL